MSAKQRKKAAAASSHSVTHTNDGNTAQSNGASKFLPSSPPSSADPETATAQPLTASATPAASNGGSAVTRPPSVSSFIGKLYAIVSNPATQHIICWAEHGQSFLVKDEYAFSRNIMRQHFRHSNFSSFVRQLNFYGFHKRSTPSAVTQFDHPDFKRGREDLLPLIVRKSAGHGADGEAKSGGGGKDKGGGELYKDDIRALGQQVRQLKNQYEELAKMQQRILYVFSRYVNAEQGGRRKRYVNGAADDEEGGGSGGGTAKKARLLIEDIETRTRRNEVAGSTNSAHDPAGSAPRGGRRGSNIISPLADINWSDQHAMQDLIHSPYMRGAPAVLNTTPMPIELPPLQTNMQAAALDRRSRSPRPLLLTRGDERREEEKAFNLLPRIEVPPRPTTRKATGKFYDATDSPSSQSSTSTEGEMDRRARALSLSHLFPNPPSEAAMLAWNNTAHVGGNGVIYAPPAATRMEDMDAVASLPLSPHISPGSIARTGHVHDAGAWLNGGGVKTESDEFDLPTAAYPFSMPSTPTLEGISSLVGTVDRTHLSINGPIAFPQSPSPLPLSLPPSPVPALPLPAVVPPIEALPPLLSSSAASPPTHFPLSPFLTPTARSFKAESVGR